MCSRNSALSKVNTDWNTSARYSHLKNTEDMIQLVSVAETVLARCTRHVDWIQLPVPKARTDPAYYAALQNFDLGSTELMFGLVHYNDIDGTRERLQRPVSLWNNFQSCRSTDWERL